MYDRRLSKESTVSPLLRHFYIFYLCNQIPLPRLLRAFSCKSRVGKSTYHEISAVSMAPVEHKHTKFPGYSHSNMTIFHVIHPLTSFLESPEYNGWANMSKALLLLSKCDSPVIHNIWYGCLGYCSEIKRQFKCTLKSLDGVKWHATAKFLYCIT